MLFPLPYRNCLQRIYAGLVVRQIVIFEALSTIPYFLNA